MGNIIKFRHNIMNVSAISTFENIKGGMNSNCKDVYFVRAIGTNGSYLNDVKKLDETLLHQMNEGKSYYCRVHTLPKMPSVDVTNFYIESYSKWIENDKKEIFVKATKNNTILADMLSAACTKVEELYKEGNKTLSDSMIKNFIIKLLFWYDAIFEDKKPAACKFVWDERKSVKIVADNVEKKQEYLFYYMLTLTGCDVLLLQSSKDIGDEEKRLGLSAEFKLGTYSDIRIPEFVWHGTGEEQRLQQNTTVNSAVPAGNAVPRVTIPPRVTGETAVSSDTEKSFEELALLASSVVMIAIHDAKGEVVGSGSGIMIGEQGYILTNNHVTSGGRFYSVRIEDDENVYETDEMIKYNQFLDLAIIRINRRLTPIKVYNGSKKLVRGQKVVAIGSPLGLFNSVSNGIISGFRKIDQVDMIQFTAPTSHGSSGGAVLNMQGEVIGISTAGFSSGQNINLAVGYECINQFIRGFT